MARTACIIQSNYIPWRGYFDLIGLSDEFIIYDSVQYTKNDWRNRNRIKSERGTIWLTIPTLHSGRHFQTIEETRIAGRSWATKHWRTIVQAYRKAPYFEHYALELEGLFKTASGIELLSSVNRLWLEFTMKELGIRTRISTSSSYSAGSDRNTRLIDMCRAVHADRYLSGPAARDYLDVKAFAASNIAVEFMSYDNYSTYPQLHGPFDPFVSILDLLLNVGPRASSYMKYCGK